MFFFPRQDSNDEMNRSPRSVVEEDCAPLTAHDIPLQDSYRLFKTTFDVHHALLHAQHELFAHFHLFTNATFGTNVH